jgi:hypothetical protein
MTLSMFVIRFLDGIGLSVFWRLISFLVCCKFWSCSFCYIFIKDVALCIAFFTAHVNISVMNSQIYYI